MATDQMDDVDRMLLGGGSPSAKFPAIGAIVRGTITEKPVVKQQTDMNGGLKTFDNGDPMMQIIVTVQTDERDPEIEDDDGVRRIFVKGNMLKATREAVRAAGKSLEVGGVFAVQYTGDGVASQRGFTAPKLYAVAYQPPASAAETLLGAPAATPAATPAPAAAAPAAAPAAAEGDSPEVAALKAQLAKLGG